MRRWSAARTILPRPLRRRRSRRLRSRRAQHRRVPVLQGARARVRLVNRRCVNWPLESAPGPPPPPSAASSNSCMPGVSPHEAAVRRVVAALIAPAVADAGRRISVHLADEHGRACILVLSHHTPAPHRAVFDRSGRLPRGRGVRHRPGPDGTRLWAVIDLTAPPRSRRVDPHSAGTGGGYHRLRRPGLARHAGIPGPALGRIEAVCPGGPWMVGRHPGLRRLWDHLGVPFAVVSESRRQRVGGCFHNCSDRVVRRFVRAGIHHRASHSGWCR
ncbi:hypothetical protein BX283_0010 [Streptomyces sp. TLI_146]|nr:hypothetical protein BX283_0010 [Streptomyces sp. TLI_146]